MNVIRDVAKALPLPPLSSRQFIRAGTLMATFFLLVIGYMYLQLPLPANISSSLRLTEPTVELVVASLKGDDVSWLHDFIPKWTPHVYIVNDQKALLTVPRNKGREAMVYLT
jgi:hypothetical protein